MIDSGRKLKTPRSCSATLKNRGACILKKARELSVLCGIKVCALILDPAGKVHTWPENQVEVIDFLKQFKKAEKKQCYGVKAIADKDQCYERKTMDKTKELDFSCFDDKLINGLSKDSVTEIKIMLSSKIEAAKKRVEFLKMKEMTNFNPTPNFDPLFNAYPDFDPNFYFPQMQSTLPSIIGIPDSYNPNFDPNSYFPQMQSTLPSDSYNPNSDPNFYFPQMQSTLPLMIDIPDSYNPNSDPNFHFPQMQSTLPSIIDIPDSYNPNFDPNFDFPQMQSTLPLMIDIPDSYNPNFDPNFYFPQIQSTLPSMIGIPDSYFSHEQFGAIGLGC